MQGSHPVRSVVAYSAILTGSYLLASFMTFPHMLKFGNWNRAKQTKLVLKETLVWVASSS